MNIELLETLKVKFEEQRTLGKKVTKSSDPIRNAWGLGNVVAWDDALKLLTETIQQIERSRP